MNFGEYLRNLREEKHMSIRQLSTYSGVSHGYISQVERGERGTPSPEILQKLAPVLKVSYETLMKQAGYLERTNTRETPEQRIEDAISDDPELLDFWQELKEREDLQLLFKQVKPLPPEAIKRIIRYIKMVEDEEAMEDEY